ncbi:MAG: histidinol dehydrogenase [Methanomassiliicoccales archaeon]|jgi:histidinol dehydrogenase|nr:histidinol dehydrogenase [Methanomassiliicoccales archaeon]
MVVLGFMWQPLDLDAWLKKRSEKFGVVKTSVMEILDAVKNGGNKALIELTERFDGIKIESIEVSKEERRRALRNIPPSLMRALEIAKLRIERFHQMQLEGQSWFKEVDKGISLGMKLTPLRRIGAYIPGGKASYPSTALMCVVPARVAGVNEVCCCSPPPVSDTTLAALEIAGVDEVYKIGGAQAIAAMAFGTESIRPVQKIVGPGNIFVTTAKLLVMDRVGIDFPAGPSDIVVIADETSCPQFVAADIIAQAEHDPNAMCFLISLDKELLVNVERLIIEMVQKAERKKIIQDALKNMGAILVRNLEEAVAIVDKIAPEHLSIQTKNPESLVDMVHNAGSIFVGSYSAVACGDYASGPNHVLPTGGYAAIYSGLDIRHFCKASFVQSLSREGLGLIADTVIEIARAEGLYAHADSVRIRLAY